MLFGGCGLFQTLYIFIAQYFLRVGNYLVIILIPVGVTFALFYASTVIFDSYAQVKRRKKIKQQFAKRFLRKVRLERFLNFPVVKPLLFIFIIFSACFFSAYFICIVFFNNLISFIIAENIGTIVCILVANLIEKVYGRVQRY